MTSWLDDAPRWEHREISDHYEPSNDRLTSEFLETPVPLAQARKRRRMGEPLEYILNHCHVGPVTLQTDSRALIPRPETETLIRRFTERVEDFPQGPIADCGTGTGFMAGWLSDHTDRIVVATDLNETSLELARENRRYNDWDYHLVRMDRLGAVHSLAGVVANLPYVNPGDGRVDDSVKRYEPDDALYPPDSPVQFYRPLIRRLQSVLIPNGEAWFELTPDLCQKLYKYSETLTHWEQRWIEDDLQGVTRYLGLKRSP